MNNLPIGTEVVHVPSGEVATVTEPPNSWQWERESPEVKEAWTFVRRGGGEVVMTQTRDLKPYAGHGAMETKRQRRGSTSCPHCGIDYPHIHDRKGFPHPVNPGAASDESAVKDEAPASQRSK